MSRQWVQLQGIARMQGFESIRVLGTDLQTGRLMDWFAKL
jgi:hypothetical protein